MRAPLKLTIAALAAIGAAATILACSSTTTTSSPNPATDPDSGGPTDDAAVAEPDAEPEVDSAAPAPFKLTSTSYAEGAKIPSDHVCTSAGFGGKDQSPPLAWGPGPAGTKSYAIVFNDDTISFLHSIVYDIPTSANALPAALAKVAAPPSPAGTKQTKNYKGIAGYAGPCPPSGEHTYEFTLYALDIDKLAVTASVTLADAEAEITKHSLKSTKLTGKFAKP